MAAAGGAPEHAAPVRGRRLRAGLGVAAALVVLGAVSAAAIGLGGAEPARPAATNRPPAVARVSRTTLTQTERVGGTLGYEGAALLLARPSARGTAPGTLTWLPAVGTVVRPGRPAYKVDGRPVVLLSGAAPLWRALATGTEGADVKLLERNLRTFGYGGFTTDARFTASTAAAVRRWQRRLGLRRTGTVDLDQVVVAPTRIRVTEHRAAPGAPASGEVLAYTRTTRVVTVPLEVDRQHLVKVGMAATVTLPDGGTVTGRVARIGTVATPVAAGQGVQGGPPGQGDRQAPATVDVTVTITDQAKLGTLDAAPVDLTLTVRKRADVLTVPVGALVALAEGGYGVQVVEGAGSRYVAVTTGMFAAGKVEIAGAGIREGLAVGVPA